MAYMWRCFCYVGDPPRVCDCENHGVWLCSDCEETLDVFEVIPVVK